jgi:hypothetical protein
MALLDHGIEIFERAPGFFGRRRLSAHRQLIAFGADADADFLLDLRQILLKLTEKNTCVLVIVIGQDEMRRVRIGCWLGQLRSPGQTLLLLLCQNLNPLAKQAVLMRVRDSHFDNVPYFAAGFI